MLGRIVAILFPLLFVVGVGYFCGRRMKPDMSFANRLNMDVFVPALVFATLAAESFSIARYQALAWGTLGVIVGSGLIAWLLARFIKAQPKTLVPPIMFNNCGNLGLPLAVLTFGDGALAAAVVMFVISNLLHFSYGAWLLDHRVRWTTLWRVPTVFATFAGVAISLWHVEVWSPLMVGLKMLGGISIPLLLFALGVRLAGADFGDWRIGLVGAVARPVAGMIIAAAIGWLLGLDPRQHALLFLFGALPPAVLNYVFAEHYRQEPHKVASIVLIGNVAALAFLPLALALVIG
ncbi:MAG: AEC family transporter [Sulfurifustis sp.]